VTESLGKRLRVVTTNSSAQVNVCRHIYVGSRSPHSSEVTPSRPSSHHVTFLGTCLSKQEHINSAVVLNQLREEYMRGSVESLLAAKHQKLHAGLILLPAELDQHVRGQKDRPQHDAKLLLHQQVLAPCSGACDDFTVRSVAAASELKPHNEIHSRVWTLRSQHYCAWLIYNLLRPCSWGWSSA
jgi:hypothetical protein